MPEFRYAAGRIAESVKFLPGLVALDMIFESFLIL